MEWSSILAGIRAKKLEIARLDPRRGMPVLPPSYVEFLSRHDGWPQLLHGTSLLGAHQLARGTFDGVARSTIEMGDHADAELVAFGCDADGECIFAWDASRRRDDGELEVVVWVNDIGARLDDFPALLDFVDAVLEADVLSLHRARVERPGPVAADSARARDARARRSGILVA